MDCSFQSTSLYMYFYFSLIHTNKEPRITRFNLNLKEFLKRVS